MRTAKYVCAIALCCCAAMGVSAEEAWAQSAKSKNAPHAAKKATPKPEAAAREKLAEGRYELVDAAGQTKQLYTEPWTLYRTGPTFELEEQWRVGPANALGAGLVDVSVGLAAGLYPIQVRLGGEKSSKQMICSMALTEFKCLSDGRETKLPMRGAYNLFLPSPWMMGSIARRARKIPNESANVQLVMMAGMEATGPKLVSFPAQVQYVGDDELTIRGEKLAANIYELKSAAVLGSFKIPATLIWTSSEGVVLAMQDSTKSDQRIELVEYKKYGKF